MPHLIVVHSPLETEESVKKRLESEIENVIHNLDNLKNAGLVSGLEKADEVIKNLKGVTSGVVILVATGGTEEIIEKITIEIEAPILLWVNQQKNSFAASLEAYAFLKDQFPVKLYYSENLDSDRERISEFMNVCRGISRINKAHVGLIGEPSDWLLQSKKVKTFGNFRTKLTKFKIKELTELVESITDADSHSVAGEFKKNYGEVNVTDDALQGSAKVYVAMKRLIEKNELTALTIRCFDLLENKYTACMGMSVCNDEGIVSGCEGDLHATFSMMIGAYLTGQPAWMANPSGIDKANNSIILAHCTVPSKMIGDLSKSSLTTHMESGLSTAIQGLMQKKKVTIFRIGGNFDRITVITGNVVNPYLEDKSLCRTQIKIKCDGSISKWIEESLGNHQVMVYEDITGKLQDFCLFTRIKFQLIE
ncbi:MAG: hypothetical protein A2V66_08770 [Ignavibacteria bacterium RBG_13_36_8]|nr:MAG: hypothetical protein A2V66_08770 [Ignavibacteria bacterium RBG_13_36_8]